MLVDKHWRWYNPVEEEESDHSEDGWIVSTETRELSGQQNMNYMAEVAG